MTQISVCMATFNGEKFIQKQVKSILVQLGQEDELIVSDDSSTDNTLAILEKLADKRIKITFNDGRPGPVGNFEQAMKRARGNIIILSDQDDVWLPDKVNTIRYLLQSADLVLSDCRVVDENDGMLYPSFFSHRNSQPGFWYNLYKNSYVGCCMAFRAEILTYALPIPASIHMHDWWIGLLVEAKGKTHFHSKPLINYVRHGSNASPTGETGYDFPKRLRNRFTLLWYIIKRLIK
ncbi:glycosyltransferase family 2 protein [Fibrella aquatica]|uniref:glycosyltransferase family 2 protein n=1 Tax=Fibrella aquatica TaxID=3242487 RepID=UPI00351F9E5D